MVSSNGVMFTVGPFTAIRPCARVCPLVPSKAFIVAKGLLTARIVAFTILLQCWLGHRQLMFLLTVLQKFLPSHGENITARGGTGEFTRLMVENVVPDEIKVIRRIDATFGASQLETRMRVHQVFVEIITVLGGGQFRVNLLGCTVKARNLRRAK